MVSSSSTTGSQNSFGEIQKNYFERIAKMELKNPQIVGFGIANRDTFLIATKHQKGAIIGSSFVNYLKKNEISSISNYIKLII
jgi:tryptophan synthase alpha chain